MFPFSPASEESSAHAKSGKAKTKSASNGIVKSKSRRVVIAFRKFRPELLAEVESREGSPSRVRFFGACGNVVAASGPWRTSGDWWEEHGWQEDEWDVEIHFDSSGHKKNSHSRAQDGIYRIYFDWMRRGWFVRGRYD